MQGGKFKLRPMPAVLVSTSLPNSQPLPLTNKSIPNSSGFSMQLYPSLTQNCRTAFFASASWIACCSSTNCLNTASLLITQEGAVSTSDPFSVIKAVSAVDAGVVEQEGVPGNLKRFFCREERFQDYASLFSLPLFIFG